MTQVYRETRSQMPCTHTFRSVQLPVTDKKSKARTKAFDGFCCCHLLPTTFIQLLFGHAI